MTARVRVIPERVHLLLEARSTTGGLAPVLRLSAVGGGGIDFVSDLEIATSRSDGALRIEVRGFEHEAAEGPAPAVLRTSEAGVGIDLDWLGQGLEREIIVALRDVEARFSVRRDAHTLALRTLSPGLVELEVPAGAHTILGYIPPEGQEVSGTAEIDLYPDDVGVLSVSGYPRQDVDYRPQLERFALRMGLEPAHRAHPGLVQRNRAQLLVVVRDRPLPAPARSELLGPLEEEPRVLVSLARAGSFARRSVA